MKPEYKSESGFLELEKNIKEQIQNKLEKKEERKPEKVKRKFFFSTRWCCCFYSKCYIKEKKKNSHEMDHEIRSNELKK